MWTSLNKLLLDNTQSPCKSDFQPWISRTILKWFCVIQCPRLQNERKKATTFIRVEINAHWKYHRHTNIGLQSLFAANESLWLFFMASRSLLHLSAGWCHRSVCTMFTLFQVCKHTFSSLKVFQTHCWPVNTGHLFLFSLSFQLWVTVLLKDSRPCLRLCFLTLGNSFHKTMFLISSFLWMCLQY